MTKQPRFADSYPEGSPERAVAEVIDLYDQGMRYGDANAMLRAFHESAWMHGHVEGGEPELADIHWPIARFIQGVAKFGSDWDAEDLFRSEVTTFAVSGRAATVGLRETNGRGRRNLDDFFTLYRFDDGWRITSKVFTHVTEGEAR